MKNNTIPAECVKCGCYKGEDSPCISAATYKDCPLCKELMELLEKLNSNKETEL